jgi:hypothetical protein
MQTGLILLCDEKPKRCLGIEEATSTDRLLGDDEEE